MDLIPLADPVRIKTIPRDDPSAEAGMAGALAAFLSVLGGNAGDTPTPVGQSAPEGARTEVAAASATPIRFFDDAATGTAGTPDASAGPASGAPASGEDVLPEPAIPEVVTGTSEAGIAEAEAEAPAMPAVRPNDPPPDTAHGAQAASDAPVQRPHVLGPPPATGGSLPVGDGTAVGDRATDPETGRSVREGKSGAKPVAMPAQAAMPSGDSQAMRPSGAREGDAGRPAAMADLQIGERVSTGYTVSRAESGRVAPVPPRDQGAGGSGHPLPASEDAPRVPAADDRASPAPGLRPVAVPTASAAPESVAATPRLFATAETAGAERADRQAPPVTPSRPAGAQAVGGTAGLPQPTPPAAAEAAGRTPAGTSPARAGREDVAASPTAQAVAASPTVAAGRGGTLPADSAWHIPTAADAEPAEIPIDPADPLASTADAAPLARDADRVAAGHPATGALPPGLGHRLAAAISQFPDRPVEITLSPEELGRVRLTLTTHDGALTMMIQADQPETLDLMRRNIESLAQDFRDLGYQELSFSFGQDRDPRHPPGAAGTIAAAGNDTRQEIAATETPGETPGRDRVRTAAEGGGLDLRL